MATPTATSADGLAVMNSAEFFARAMARLSFDVPPGLHDASVIPTTGDVGNDRMIEIVAQERPIRPAAVLIGIVSAGEFFAMADAEQMREAP